MGREVRRVALNWNHPKDLSGRYIPLYNQTFEDALLYWQSEFIKWKNGERDEVMARRPELNYQSMSSYLSFCDWHGDRPVFENYMPKWDDGEELGYAVYENVSEGTPVTPTFATKEELVDYLTTFGTFWDDTPWDVESAKSFVKAEWTPTFVVSTA